MSNFLASNFLVPGEPTNLKARVINSSTVEVSWDPPVDKDQNGIIRGYQIHVQPKNVVSSFIYLVLGGQKIYSIEGRSPSKT